MTKKELTKKAIVGVFEKENNTFYTVPNLHVLLGESVSVDTVRAAVKELFNEGALETFKEKGSIYYRLVIAAPAPVKSKKWAFEKGPEKEKKDKSPTKSDLVRAIFEKTDLATVEEISAIIGSDLKNTRTLISILSNPSRTKNPLPVEYDRENKTFKKV